jgi:SNF2 family DNA or RNA helicase
LADKYPSINYLKLTSDVKIGERFTVAQVFNGDSDIKILLVTKAIGG